MKESRIVDNTNQYTPQNIKIATHRGELLGVVDKLKNKYDGLKDTERNRKEKLEKEKHSLWPITCAFPNWQNTEQYPLSNSVVSSLRKETHRYRIQLFEHFETFLSDLILTLPCGKL